MNEETLKAESLLFSKCKCCLGDGDLKNLWGEYKWNGVMEIYGEMLSECFDITLLKHTEQTHDSDLEHICDSCICRLRDALDFKREVLACEQLRFEHLNNKVRVKVKTEQCTEDLDDYSIDNTTELDDIEPLFYGFKEEGNESVDVQDFQDVEYLEIDEDKEECALDKTSDTAQQNNDQQQTDSQTASPPRSPDTDAEQKPKRKWPKKRRGINRIYKQYTRAEMLMAVNAVENGSMSRSQASDKYNVPLKTLTAWLNNKNQSVSDEKIQKELSYHTFVDEVKMILTYTNAVPFKTKSARYFCAYCSTDGPFFEDPDELRVHTRTKHVDDRMRNTEIILRPRHQNETLKMDIDSLHCTVCCVVLTTWSSMFKHLLETHSIKLKEAYTKVIPYILKRELKCALCSEQFSHFHILDGHMNCHYSTYICQDCGDTFLSSIRLNKHVQVHLKGRYPCHVCGKVFTLDKYRQKHYDLVHQREHKIKCLYCPQKFYGIFQRHLHVVEKHNDKVKVITCEYCGLRFDWKSYYIAHLRRKHKIGLE